MIVLDEIYGNPLTCKALWISASLRLLRKSTEIQTLIKLICTAGCCAYRAMFQSFIQRRNVRGETVILNSVLRLSIIVAVGIRSWLYSIIELLHSLRSTVMLLSRDSGYNVKSQNLDVLELWFSKIG
jgi:hypothetical protein